MDEYQKTFGLDGAGPFTGLIFIIYNLGSLAALPFSGFLSDTWGRRLTIFIGCTVILLSPEFRRQQTISQCLLPVGSFWASAPHWLRQLLRSTSLRLLILHTVAFRVACTTIFGGLETLFLDGPPTAATRPSRTAGHGVHPYWFSASCPSSSWPAYISFPSPSWLITHDREEEAAAIFAKYHCDDDTHHPLVSLQVDDSGADGAAPCGESRLGLPRAF
ncbi:hypothetical protein GMDG_07477 [Pseudogymnoascus destructans 20631-21]|uniref:Major facilitator superfamily (MFS) profile domain-containing protein n=1 Tax=Pseudogymnoascus destructans (strain ATCC MYA-4855 / 20631-21) TaxID=658429 RepID=L8FXH9_PSED2|nr:hypothetical protein GMDG_07477 [Pseudogymnoascus destructans 20631-21]